jgi:mono/diheme cytochrome c family protein
MARRWALALVVCAVASGCGAGDDSSGIEVSRLQAGAKARGEELFSRNCGACHTLSAAGTNGTRGVNLDYRKVSVDDALFAIRNGGFGGELMPANIVTGDNAEDVAKFVASVSGSKASGNLDSPEARRLEAAPAGAQAGDLAAPTRGISTEFLRAAFNSAQSLWQQKFAAAGVHYDPRT